jgi:hypothetical protein
MFYAERMVCCHLLIKEKTFLLIWRNEEKLLKLERKRKVLYVCKCLRMNFAEERRNTNDTSHISFFFSFDY